MRFLQELRPALMGAAPALSAVLTLAAGAMLLVSGATPTEVERMRALAELEPHFLLNLSHFASSLLGLVLILLAWGLKERLDAAWTGAVVVSAVAAVLAVLKAFAWEESVALAALTALLIPLRPAFFRRSALWKMEVTPGWVAAAGALTAGAVLITFWSFDEVVADELWWRVLTDADAGRALRAAVGISVAVLAFGIWRLIATPATPPVIGEDDPGFERVRQILASAEDPSPEQSLALLGDKRFLFSESGESFLMFGVRGRSWIALGAPVGRLDEREELLWRFRELADAHAARPGFFSVGPDLLPELVDLGFSIQKTGEYAAVPLKDFSMAGRRREVLRRNWRKAAEAGATFELVEAERVYDLLPQLQAVSDAWLATQAGGEKGFSLGGFVPGYVCEFPCAVVRFQGAIVAFATLWTTPDRSAFSMDLMRYDERGPKNVMDFLFVELLLWGQKQGYAAFDFGVAPLAGLPDRPLAPALSRLGRFVFENGEDFYNFQGVRRYKDKYDPVWEPRYVAAPHRWAIPVLLADVGLLSAGGVAGLTRRAKPAPRPEPVRPNRAAATTPEPVSVPS